MTITDSTDQRFKAASLLSRYGVAVGAAALATLLTLHLWPLTAQIPFLLFFAAVMISAWYGGLGPGLLTTALAAASSAYFLLPPFYSLEVNAFENIIRLGLFVLVALMMSFLNARCRRAEEAERAQREYFQVTLASIGDAVIVTDPTGAVTFLNHVAEEMTGWTTADAMGKPLHEVFHIVNEETRQPVESPVTKVLRTGAVAGLANHTVLLRKDGHACPIDDSAAPIGDTHDQVLGVILVFRDIAERRQSEEALRDSEQRWRTLAEALPAMVWMARPDGFLDYYNQRWYDYTGLTAEQLAGWGWEAVWHPEDLVGGRAHWLEALRTGQPYEYEARFRRAADASYRWHLIRAVPQRDSAGQVLRWFGTNTDIEEQKRTEETLRENMDELQRFNHVAVGRELRMIELKKEVNELCLLQGVARRYPLDFEQDGEEPRE